MTEASARGIARLAKDAEAGHPVIITRHGKPVAAVVPIASDPAVNPAEPVKTSPPNRDNPALPLAPMSGKEPAARANRTSATERWVQAVTGSSRRVPGPPAGA